MTSVAIITRTVDRPVLLERALRSILAQTFLDWHWVVVDSGSGDSVERLMAQYSAQLGGRITHLRFSNPKPGMRGVPINAGIAASQSQFITLLDDDDTWAPEFLHTMVAALECRPVPSVRGAVCRTLCIEESSVESGLKQERTWELNADLCHVTLPALAVVNRFCTHAFLYERAALETVGLYPEDYPVLEDWHFNLRFLL
ncbi:MAG: glycosyltransferase family 2 protein, partial [Roseimicrobium sp.]